MIDEFDLINFPRCAATPVGSNRVCAVVDQSSTNALQMYFATDRDVRCATLPMPIVNVDDNREQQQQQQQQRKRIVPTIASNDNAKRSCVRQSDNVVATHRVPIQSLVRNGRLLCAVDAFGNTSLTTIERAESVWIPSFAADGRERSFAQGWHGVAFSAPIATQFALASAPQRDIALFDIETKKVVAQHRCADTPYAIVYSTIGGAGGGSILIAEGECVSCLDLRQPNAYAARVRASAGPQYALCASGNTVLSGGAERIVSSIDANKWTSRYKWISPTKLDVTNLFFTSRSSEFCVVAAIDGEAVVGKHQGKGILVNKTLVSLRIARSCVR
jgi:hypothetical protein